MWAFHTHSHLVPFVDTRVHGGHRGLSSSSMTTSLETSTGQGQWQSSAVGKVTVGLPSPCVTGSAVYSFTDRLNGLSNGVSIPPTNVSYRYYGRRQLPLCSYNKRYNHTMNNFYFRFPRIDALESYKTSWLGQNVTNRVLKQLSDCASTTN